MYRFSYSEILEDAPQLARERERLAFDRALHLLRNAEASGATGPERTEAIGFVQELWNVLISDLLDPENALPDALKADLVSIGSWIMREVAEALNAPTRSLKSLIDVNTSIRDGLQ